MVIQRAILLLLLIFIRGSFQDVNRTSIVIIAPTANLTVNVAVVTLHHHQADQVTLSGRNSPSTFLSCQTSRTAFPTRTRYQQPTPTSARPSNSSTINIGVLLNHSLNDAELSCNDSTTNVTFYTTNASNATFIEQAPSDDLDNSLFRRRTANQTTESDAYPKNTTRPPTDIWDRWVTYTRKSRSACKLPAGKEGDQPLKRRKLRTESKVGLTALAAGTLYFATLDPDKRRKRQKTQEQDKTTAPTSNELCNAIPQPESRPISQEQLTPIPFVSARESISKLFEQALHSTDNSEFRLSPLDLAFVKTHKIIFEETTLEGFESQVQEFTGLLDDRIGEVTQEFMEQGYHIAITNSTAMLGFGSKNNLLIRLMDSLPEQLPEQLDDYEELLSNNDFFYSAQKLANETLDVALRRLEDPNVLPLVHVSLAFVHLVSRYDCTRPLLQIGFPWESLVNFLNVLLSSYDTSSEITARDTFPIPAETNACPLPEDFAMRGLSWAEEYFPIKWFPGNVDHEDKIAHFDSMTQRKERILWLAARIAEAFPITINYNPASYDPGINNFNNPHFSIKIGISSSNGPPNTSHSSKSSHETDVSSDSSSILPLDQSTSLLSICPESNGIHATLALPLEKLEQSLDRNLSISQANPEDLAYSTKGSPETFESWLSDLINLDIALDNNDKIEDFQTEASYDQNTSSGTKKIPQFLNAAISTDITVFCHAGNKNNSSKDPAENLGLGEQSDKDDKEQQDSEEKDRKYSLDPLIKSPPQPSLKSFPQTPPSCLSSLKASESPISPSSIPNQSKPHKCAHCPKTFTRISDMNKHVKYHTRPISCQVPACGYTCGRQTDLSRHQHGFHKDIFGKEEFPCPFEECKKLRMKFSRKDNLGRHLRNQHGGNHDGSKRTSPQ